MYDELNNGVQQYLLPAGLVLTAHSAAAGSTGTLASMASPAAFAPVALADGAPASVGPFGTSQWVSVGARGTVAVMVGGLSAAQVAALQAGRAVSSAYLMRGPAATTTPTFGGVNGAISFTNKRRVMAWAGIPGQYVYRSGTMHISDVQFGTRTSDTPSNTSFSAYATDVETGGAQPALYSPQTSGGVMSIAGGRFRQYESTGAIRLMHYADDALFSSAPRCQISSFMLPNKQRLIWSMSVQFGDSETPYPAYVSGKQNNLFWQIKGGTGQPPLAMTIERQANGSLKLYFNRKNSNASSIYTAATVAGLSDGVPIDIEVHVSLDWLTYDEGGEAYLSLLVNGSPVELFDNAGNSEGYVSRSMPTVFTDVDQAYQWIGGIYRYEYSGAKAPDASAVLFHRHVIFAV